MDGLEEAEADCSVAFAEAQRWVEAVTEKNFERKDFRASLENGVLLCDLVNKLKPGIIKKVNRLSTPIAGLDNISVFLKACEQLGLKEAQLFHPGDLQDLSNRVTVKQEETDRRVKNVLITLYWLGRKAQSNPYYNGPYLNLKAFENLLGQALTKALEDPSCLARSRRSSVCSDFWYPERVEFPDLPGNPKRDNTFESLDSWGSGTLSSGFSDVTLRGVREGSESETDSELIFKMQDLNKDDMSYRRILAIEPKSALPFNRFLPNKSRQPSYMPAPLRKKKPDKNEDNRRSWASPVDTESDGTFSSQFLLLQAFQTYSDDILSSETNVRIDPTSGPRLITRRRNLSQAPGHGRGDLELSALDPDLQNDDFFVRKTRAFHANPCVLRAFEDFRRYSEQDDPVERDIILQCREGELVLPDLEKDDMIVRRMPAQKKEVPLSGAPDRYQPVPFPEPWALPPEIQARFLSVLERTCPSKEISTSCRILVPSYGRKKDDMLARKIQSWKLGMTVPPVSFTPGPCSEADLEKWEAIREASRRRYKKRLMVERLFQKIYGENGSKSMSDVSAEDVQHLRQLRYEEMQKIKSQLKEQDQKWQDDLAKWKDRRKSYTSDLQKKKEEREEIEKQALEKSARSSKTFKEMLQDREYEHERSTSTLRKMYSSDDVFNNEELPTRLTVSEAIYQSETVQKELAPTVTLSEASYQSERVEQKGPTYPMEIPGEDSTTFSKREDSVLAEFQLSSQKPAGERPPYVSPDHALNTQMEAPRVSASLPRSYQKTDTARLTSVVTARPFGFQSRGTASLPRSYTMDNGWKYNGNFRSIKSIQNSSVSTSVPKVETSHLSASASIERQAATEDVMRLPSPTPSLSSLSQDQPDTSKATSSSVSGIDSKSEFGQERYPLQGEVSSSLDQFSDMRISINQTPGNSVDFGFTVKWDFSGIFVASVEAGSPAEFSQLQVDDEIIAINNNKFSNKDKKEWEEAMAKAQETGNLVMDVRRYGKSGAPETKWIDTTSGIYSSEKSSSVSVTTDFSESLQSPNTESKEINGIHDESHIYESKASEPISLKNLKRRSQFFEQGSSDSVAPDLPVPTVSTPSRWAWDQEEERRRQERWQKEQDRLLQEKYQREQEKLREEWQRAQQEAERENSKYLNEELMVLNSHSVSLTAREPTVATWEASWSEGSKSSDREGTRAGEEERDQQSEDVALEDQRKQLQEQLVLERERKLREQQQYQEELDRRQQEAEAERRRVEEQRQREAEAEAQRQQYQEEQERRQREAEVEAQRQQYQEEQERRQREAEADAQRRRAEEQKHLAERERETSIRIYQYRRPIDSYDLSKTEEESSGLLPTDRNKSKSTTELHEISPNKNGSSRYLDRSGETSSSQRSYKKDQGPSGAELERQQILQEMRKKTSLHNDNSWIRQRSASINKEPICLPGIMRRGESLDNLDSQRSSSWKPTSRLSQSTGIHASSSVQDFSHPPPQLLSTSNRAYLRNPSSSVPPPAAGPGKPTAQTPTLHSQSASTSQPGSQPRSRSVSGKRVCSCCNNILGKGAAMVIESLGLCYHLHCFKCVSCQCDLGGSASGAEVRIRNNQLFCNDCYLRFKSGRPTAM
ncbi:LIM domain only protein 7 isoform X11 [Ochotona princeps]|uniref:LIM domain only protein 7 isoform X11 n=1 Tax=Ochotona princeps TaxID=9978 RepID=UPI002714CCA6|nr:LIM domain only protein 7 isoform X11 [Ochotona princeps]